MSVKQGLEKTSPMRCAVEIKVFRRTSAAQKIPAIYGESDKKAVQNAMSILKKLSKKWI